MTSIKNIDTVYQAVSRVRIDAIDHQRVMVRPHAGRIPRRERYGSIAYSLPHRLFFEDASSGRRSRCPTASRGAALSRPRAPTFHATRGDLDAEADTRAIRIRE